MYYKAVCFGEVLWDNLTSGKKLGGGPLNVSYHLNRLGVSTAMITRIGMDDNGSEIELLCQESGIPITLFQKDYVHSTSTVEVQIGKDNKTYYKIEKPVAWDFIQVEEKALDIVRNADFIVFGSLASRSEISYTTLQRILDVARFKVFDMNLRTPHYTKERVLALLSVADLVTMNQAELHIVVNWLEIESDRDTDRVWTLMDIFDLQETLITYGAQGAVYYSKAQNLVYHFPAYKVEVNDTIGSEASFLAAFLTKRFQEIGDPKN